MQDPISFCRKPHSGKFSPVWPLFLEFSLSKGLFSGGFGARALILNW